MTNEQDRCEVEELHEDLIANAKRFIGSSADTEKLAELFKVLGDPTRVRILQSLRSGPLCVCDIAEILEMTQSAISHQLRILRQARLVRAQRQGRSVYYSLDDAHVEQMFAQGLEHAKE